MIHKSAVQFMREGGRHLRMATSINEIITIKVWDSPTNWIYSSAITPNDSYLAVKKAVIAAAASLTQLEMISASPLIDAIMSEIDSLCQHQTFKEKSDA